MAVLLNEVALRALLETEDGPIGRDLQRRIERVTELARRNAQRIITVFPMDQVVGSRIEHAPDGLRGIVGVEGDGTFARYLAAKEAREQVWLTPALRDGFN